jgi:hypothetical protein
MACHRGLLFVHPQIVIARARRVAEGRLADAPVLG